MAKKRSKAISNLVIVSDLHCGCKLGLCPAEGISLHDSQGGMYTPGKFQRWMWGVWQEFWHDWVPRVTRGEPYAVLVNGETVDGVHHKATTQISHNLDDQRRIAVAVMKPIVKLCQGRLYINSGTPVHSGESGCDDEAVARELGAIPDSGGRHARYETWFRVGDALIHTTHHIGTTGSSMYESTAVHKELVEAMTEAGRWRQEVPQMVVRSHRHRFISTNIPMADGFGASIVTPGWQGRTPFVFKIPGGRQSLPTVGGIIIRAGDEEVHYRQFVRTIERSAEVKL